MLHKPDRKPQKFVDRAHPSAVAFGQVIVDRDDVHAAARQRIKIHGRRRHEGLAFSRLHLGDLSLMKDDAA